MIVLNDMERDAISEAFNIGVGAAGNSLSEMLGQEVVLTVPAVTIAKKSDVARGLEDTQTELLSGVKEDFKAQTGSLRSVRERFQGPFSGSALLIFAESNSLELVRLLLQQPDMDLDFLTEMEQEALTEVGNIILNACLSAVADIIGDEIENEIPELIKGTPTEVIMGASEGGDEDYVVQLQMQFQVHHVDIEGRIAFLMDIAALDTFRKKLAEYFGFDGVA